MTTVSRQHLCDQAIRLHRDGDLTGAERLYQKLLVDDPKAFSPQHLLGIVRAQQGFGEEGAVLIEAALRIDPTVAHAWLNHGNIVSGLGRHKEALASLDRALALRPDDVEILCSRARTLLELGQPQAALADYDRLVVLRPHDVAIWNARGSIFWSLGENADARACHENALRIQPNDVEALNNLANVLRAQRCFQEALTHYDRALTILPGQPEVLNNRGATLSELGRFDEALTSLDQAVAIRPDLAEAWNNRGDALRELGRRDEALKSLERALALFPDYPAALNNRAKLLCEMSRIDEGFASFRRSTELVHDRFPSMAGTEGARLSRPALQAAEWAQSALARWLEAEPQVVVIDDFLNPDALAALRRFCQNGNVWHRAYPGGYRGAFPESGLACPLLAQIAEELRDSLPAVFAGHSLRYLWAFRYDRNGSGTHVHADEAAVNVNFWITPDEANRDTERGGLVLWDAHAPADWDFARFNDDAGASHNFLVRCGARSMVIPYRANRAVIFDSNLFHQTDRFDFAPGDDCRRINITLLFGRRQPS